MRNLCWNLSKKAILHHWHTAHHANMASFGGYDMPLMKKVLLKPDDYLQDMPYFTFQGHYQSNSSSADTVQLSDGTPILLSRTGYTGEFGFEIFVDPLHLIRVWQMLLESGFVKVKKKLKIGQTLFLQDNRRTIRVRVVKDIRPHRTARRAITEMI